MPNRRVYGSLASLTAILTLFSTTGCADGPGDGPAVIEVEETADVPTWPEADPADVTTLDGLMRAYYEVVSGPAGEARDWDRDKSLHVPGAMVVITRSGENGAVEIGKITISDYHENSGEVAANAFYEWEINRIVQQHGTTVHIWSTYEWSTEPDGTPSGQGVNSIEAIWDGNRYWLTSWTYDGRSDAPPVPEAYLPTAD